MNWQIFKHAAKTLAYEVDGRTIFITDQVDHGGKPLSGRGSLTRDEDGVNAFELLPNGRILFNNWADFYQFNHNYSLLAQIHLLNHLQAQIDGTLPETLEIAPALNEPCPFEHMDTNALDQQKSLDLLLVIEGRQIACETDFERYTFLDKEIEELPWTVARLFTFSVHLMKIIMLAERQQAQTNYFSVTDEAVQKIVDEELFGPT